MFAVPLAFFAIQLASSYHQQAQQAQVTRDGLSYIQKASLLTQVLETHRDLNTITVLLVHPFFSDGLHENKLNVLEQINLLLGDKQNTQLFLNELQKEIEDDAFFNSSLAASIDMVFEDAQSELDKVYNWRAKLSYNFVPFNRNNRHILSIINLLNETDSYTRIFR